MLARLTAKQKQKKHTFSDHSCVETGMGCTQEVINVFGDWTLHIATCIINNLLVIGAGFVVLRTDSGLADLVVALIMALLGLQGGWQVVRQARYELAASGAQA